jgi:hypothetical protein
MRVRDHRKFEESPGPDALRRTPWAPKQQIFVLLGLLLARRENA